MSEAHPVSQNNPSTHHDPVTPVASPVPLASSLSSAGHSEALPAEQLVVPDWMAKDLASPDVRVRLKALETWAQQGRPGSVDPLMLALNDADERVRTRALQLIEQDWMAEQAAQVNKQP